MTGVPPVVPDWFGYDDHQVCGAPLRWGPVPATLTNAPVTHDLLEASDDQILVRLPSGRVLAERTATGFAVTIEPAAGLTPADVAFLVYGWAVSGVLTLRGVTVLHASTVTTGERTLVVAGGSGSGKSTTVGGLAEAGWRLVVDDVTAISMRDSVPWVLPFARPAHVSAGVAGAIGPFDAVPLPGRAKVAVSLPQDLVARPVDAVVVLRRYAARFADAVPDDLVGRYGAVRVRRLEPVAALAELRRHLRVHTAALTPGRRAATIAWLRDLARRPVFVVARPAQGRSEPDVVAAVDQVVAGAG